MEISPKKFLITTNPEQFFVRFWHFTIFYAWNPVSLQTPQEGIFFSKRDLWYKIHFCDPQRCFFFFFALLKQKLFLIKKKKNQPYLILWGSVVKNAGDVGPIPGLGRSPRERNGNPLQYSCLGNPMDRGAWLSTVYGVTKSHAQLSDYTPPPHWKDWKVEGLCLQIVLLPVSERWLERITWRTMPPPGSRSHPSWKSGRIRAQEVENSYWTMLTSVTSS